MTSRAVRAPLRCGARCARSRTAPAGHPAPRAAVDPRTATSTSTRPTTRCARAASSVACASVRGSRTRLSLRMPRRRRAPDALEATRALRRSRAEALAQDTRRSPATARAGRSGGARGAYGAGGRAAHARGAIAICSGGRASSCTATAITVRRDGEPRTLLSALRASPARCARPSSSSWSPRLEEEHELAGPRRRSARAGRAPAALDAPGPRAPRSRAPTSQSPIGRRDARRRRCSPPS